MAYDPQHYRSKNVYLPHELAKRAEKRAAAKYMSFSVYIRDLIVEDILHAQELLEKGVEHAEEF